LVALLKVYSALPLVIVSIFFFLFYCPSFLPSHFVFFMKPTLSLGFVKPHSRNWFDLGFLVSSFFFFLFFFSPFLDFRYFLSRSCPLNLNDDNLFVYYLFFLRSVLSSHPRCTHDALLLFKKATNLKLERNFSFTPENPFRFFWLSFNLAELLIERSSVVEVPGSFCGFRPFSFVRP